MTGKKYSTDRPQLNAELERIIKTRAGHSCEVSKCGDHSYLEIHHIDENRENNTQENLILLCRKHHAMAHEGKIDRKSLKIYISKSQPLASSASNLDIKAINLITNSFKNNNFISRLRNEEFIGRIETDFVDKIHSMLYIWQDPFSQFNDQNLNKLNNELRAACESLSRIHAQKTFPPIESSGYYEVPKYHDEDHYYREIDSLKEASLIVSNSYDSLVRAAVAAGVDC